ncbi:MmgE/PrpD family protein [Rhodococcus sp. A14]|uniref:MmgE/PrpD family protein n=1 Tax=Rhodococcus sp. A14 TaxID=1194106 RepID=UPI00141EE843|nr:MmgE/PrpD family protein [Rhodococcus sp. A14]
MSTPITATAQVAELAATSRIPASGTAGREKLVSCVLDHLTCLLAGQKCPHVAAPRQWAVAAGGAEEATAVGGSRLPAFLAAYVNGQTANGLDWDDMLVGHPGSAIISAAIAACESNGGSLADAARGVMAGYEVHWALSRAAHPSAGRSSIVRGFTAWEAVAATAAAAVARSASEATIARALGVVATHAPVPYLGKWYERPVPSVKNNLGWAAAIGVMSTQLAEQGVSGVTNVLDGPNGLWVMAGSDKWDWQPSGDAMAAIERVGFKQYPACWHIQEQLVTVADLLTRSPIGGRQDVVVTYGGPPALRRFMDWAPAGSADLAFSLPTLTALLLDGQNLDSTTLYDPANVSRAVRKAENCVRYQEDGRSWVRIADTSGSELSSDITDRDEFNPGPRGLNADEVVAKYLRTAEPILGDGRADELKTIVEGDWEAHKITELTAYFS